MIFIYSATMEGEGHINTSFLTTKLPTWAGVRQNVTGSDLNGRPVPAFIPPEEVRAAEDCGVLEISSTTESMTTRSESATSMDPVYEALKATLEDIKSQLSQLFKSMKKFEDRLEVVEEELDAAVEMEADEDEDDDEA